MGISPQIFVVMNFFSEFLLLMATRSKAELRRLKIRAMAHSQNRLRLLALNSFVFVDSLAFFDASLDTLVETLRKSNHDFPLLKQSGLATTPEQLDLLKSKLPFPYSSLTSLEKFRSMKEVPPISAFDNDLSLEKATEESYELVKKIFRVFKLRNCSELLRLYNLSDTYLLAEAITAFRDAAFKHFGLDMVCQGFTLSKSLF